MQRHTCLVKSLSNRQHLSRSGGRGNRREDEPGFARANPAETRRLEETVSAVVIEPSGAPSTAGRMLVAPSPSPQGAGGPAEGCHPPNQSCYTGFAWKSGRGGTFPCPSPVGFAGFEWEQVPVRPSQLGPAAGVCAQPQLLLLATPELGWPHRVRFELCVPGEGWGAAGPLSPSAPCLCRCAGSPPPRLVLRAGSPVSSAECWVSVTPSRGGAGATSRSPRAPPATTTGVTQPARYTPWITQPLVGK